MKIKSLLFVFLWVFFSCTNTTEKPKNLVDEEKMVLVISDFYLHQQAGYISDINLDVTDFSKIDALILKNHQLSYEDFKESYRYYYLHPEMFNSLLIAIRDNLESKLTESDRKKRVDDRNNKTKDKK